MNKSYIALYVCNTITNRVSQVKLWWTDKYDIVQHICNTTTKCVSQVKLWGVVKGAKKKILFEEKDLFKENDLFKEKIVL